LAQLFCLGKKSTLGDTLERERIRLTVKIFVQCTDKEIIIRGRARKESHAGPKLQKVWKTENFFCRLAIDRDH